MVPVAYMVLNWLFYEISLNLLCLVHHDLAILWNESDGPVFLSESRLRKISLSIQNNMNTHTSKNIDNVHLIIQIVYMHIGKEIVNDIKKRLQKPEKSKINYIQMSRAKMEKNDIACL